MTEMPSFEIPILELSPPMVSNVSILFMESEFLTYVF